MSYIYVLRQEKDEKNMPQSYDEIPTPTEN